MITNTCCANCAEERERNSKNFPKKRGMKMKWNKMLLLVLATVWGLMGCQEVKPEDLSQTASVAYEYLEQQGYEVLSYEKHQENYTLTESKVETEPYNIYWKLPGNDPSLYFGKTVDVETFIVKNHPLDDWEGGNGLKSKGKVYTFVYVVEDEVVGGTSFPYGLKNAAGGYWSLDGKTGD